MPIAYPAGHHDRYKIVKFKIEPANAAEHNGALFFLESVDQDNPFNNVRPANADQELATLRARKVVEVMRRFGSIVSVEGALDSAGTAGASANEFSALVVGYELKNLGLFDLTSTATAIADIVDTIGFGASFILPKTRKGILNSLAELEKVSYDGGTTTLTGAGSAAAVTLPDGSASTGLVPLTGGLTALLM